MAVLDSESTDTVYGETWPPQYLHSLSCDKQKQINNFRNNSSFKFGDSNLAKCLKKVQFLC